MSQTREQAPRKRKSRRPRRGDKPHALLRHMIIAALWAGVLLAVAGVATAWLASRASLINEHLHAASALVPQLKDAVVRNDSQAVAATVEDIILHTTVAKSAVSDPLWVIAGAAPWIGPNFQAVSEVARTADDVANLGAAPLARVFESLDWEALMPTSGGVELGGISEAAPTVRSVAHAVGQSSDRLEAVEAQNLIPEISGPLLKAREELASLRTGLDAAASVTTVLPDMLGASSPRSYLLMIQNNAEARASGGIPGALAVLSVDQGRLTLGAQSSAGDLGVMTPPLAVDSVQAEIYSTRLGMYMQDVNLTPDFPTAASTAQAFWESRTGQRVDGVISIDPVALSYVLAASGPIQIEGANSVIAANSDLPTELNSGNVVKTLLSDVYSKIDLPALQDAYFAGVAQEIFAALSQGKGDPRQLIEGISRGADEGRVLLWSSAADEQSIIGNYVLSGSIAGPSVSPAQFGVFFNDGTGAKMDYYVKRTVQLIKECPRDGYEQTTVRVTNTNTAPIDAATSLPAYVTGDGNFGVPPGSVETNIIAYGPVQANVETAKVDGEGTGFAPYLHSNRPLGVIAIRLAPSESRTVDFTFGKIVQHTEPDVVVTPTVQDVKDVTLPTSSAACS